MIKKYWKKLRASLTSVLNRTPRLNELDKTNVAKQSDDQSSKDMLPGQAETRPGENKTTVTLSSSGAHGSERRKKIKHNKANLTSIRRIKSSKLISVFRSKFSKFSKEKFNQSKIGDDQSKIGDDQSKIGDNQLKIGDDQSIITVPDAPQKVVPAFGRFILDKKESNEAQKILPIKLLSWDDRLLAYAKTLPVFGRMSGLNENKKNENEREQDESESDKNESESERNESESESKLIERNLRQFRPRLSNKLRPLSHVEKFKKSNKPLIELNKKTLPKEKKSFSKWIKNIFSRNKKRSITVDSKKQAITKGVDQKRVVPSFGVISKSTEESLSELNKKILLREKKSFSKWIKNIFSRNKKRSIIVDSKRQAITKGVDQKRVVPSFGVMSKSTEESLSELNKKTLPKEKKSFSKWIKNTFSRNKKRPIIVDSKKQAITKGVDQERVVPSFGVMSKSTEESLEAQKKQKKYRSKFGGSLKSALPAQPKLLPKWDVKNKNEREKILSSLTNEKFNLIPGLDNQSKLLIETQPESFKKDQPKKEKKSIWQKIKKAFSKKPKENEDVVEALKALIVMPRDPKTIKEEAPQDKKTTQASIPIQIDSVAAAASKKIQMSGGGGGVGGGAEGPGLGGDERPPKRPWWKQIFAWRPERAASVVVIVMLILIACCLAFILWASFFQIEIASSASGTIVPMSKVNRVEHLEGGIIEKVMVHEGEKVKKGQSLIVLDATASASELSKLKHKVAEGQVDVARLTAEQEGADIVNYPPDIVKNNLDLITESDKLFNFRTTRYKNELMSKESAVTQKQQLVSEVSERLKHEIEELKLISAQVDISEKLLKEGISNKFTHLALLREAKALQSKVAQDVEVLKKSNAELAEAQSGLSSFINLHDEEISKELQEKLRELKENELQLVKYADLFKRTIIRSPIDGVVRQIYSSTEGEVIRPGEALMDIVPSDDKLVVDAELAIPDIGYIQLGQTAKIRIASADAMRFDAIAGKVFFISPDAIKPEDQRAQPYYLVRVDPEAQYFKSGNVKYELYPGMKVSVDIITGHRSVMAYILDPVFGITQRALRER